MIDETVWSVENVRKRIQNRRPTNLRHGPWSEVPPTGFCGIGPSTGGVRVIVRVDFAGDSGPLPENSNGIKRKYPATGHGTRGAFTLTVEFDLRYECMSLSGITQNGD